MKLSIVLPVYNVENYIEECFDSLYSQLDNSCELLLVDDGSKDSSGEKCDDFSALSNNIYVIHKENGGLASARNAGLKAAKGEYIIFVDSDDRVAQGCIKQIIQWIDEDGADLCFMQAVKFFSDGTRQDLGDCIERNCIRFKEKKDVLYYLSTRPKFPGSSCTKIYRRSFLVDNNLMFPLENIQSEDLGFVRDCIMIANSYDCLDIPFYEYRQNRVGSITNTTTKRAISGLLCFVEETIKLYSCNYMAIEPYGRYALSFGAYEYGVLLYDYACYEGKDDVLLNRVKESKWILDYSISKRQKFIKMIINVLGVEKGSKMFKLLYAVKNKVSKRLLKV